ncbi:uncharacterized protein LOC121700719 [Alosa sapidissima]|uniref:uncharacterized protein LOC121700719 n=1 Tax=Alosa sapidissima TaxID=34773 RepID=UPI001C0A2773|nr:uncharacterized protein LOC121700719 [Alosa sapidissima]
MHSMGHLSILHPSAPPDVTQVNVVTRSETQLELEWTKVNNNNDYTYILRDRNGEANITGSDAGTTVNVVTRSETHLQLEWTKVNNDNNYNYTLRDNNGAEVDFTGSDAVTTLEWTKINNDNNYNYILRDSNGAEADITGSDAGTIVKHTVSYLSAGTNYSFTLFTVFEGVSSIGRTFSAVTVPSDVTQVNVVTRSETHLQLEWTKVNNDNNYNYILRDSNGAEVDIAGSDAGTTVKHTVSSLSAGTNYSFTLFTVFDGGVRSTGYTFSEITIPPDVAQANVATLSETHLELEWTKVNNDNNYNYILRVSNGAETNITGSDAGTTVKHTVASLSAGTNYSFTLFTVFEGVSSTGFTFSAVTGMFPHVHFQ